MTKKNEKAAHAPANETLQACAAFSILRSNFSRERDIKSSVTQYFAQRVLTHKSTHVHMTTDTPYRTRG